MGRFRFASCDHDWVTWYSPELMKSTLLSVARPARSKPITLVKSKKVDRFHACAVLLKCDGESIGYEMVNGDSFRPIIGFCLVTDGYLNLLPFRDSPLYSIGLEPSSLRRRPMGQCAHVRDR